jgi:lipopolysaccharide export system permease protein
VRTLHRHITRQVVASLLMAMAVFTFVLLLGNVLKEILTWLINRQATLGLVVEAVGLLVPFVCVFALPMAMLTSVLLVFGRFSADQEFTAIRASGISLLPVITPVLLISLLLCAVSALVNLEIAPRCRVAYVNLRFRLVAGLSTALLPEDHVVKDFPGYIFLVGRNENGNLRDVMVFQLEHETNVTMTILAPRGKIVRDEPNQQIILHLYNANFARIQNGRVVTGFFADHPLGPLNLTPTAKAEQKPGLRDMTFNQLQDELSDLENRFRSPRLGHGPGGETRALEEQLDKLTSPVRVQIHRQVAFSFACFGFTLIGIPLGIRVHRRETNVGVAIALGLVLVYYSFVVLGQALATRPEWSPHLIVWLPNFIFQAVGAALLWRAHRG